MAFFRKRATRKIVLQWADIHSGHRLGLCNPDTELPDEDERGNPIKRKPDLTAVQRYLWRCFLADLGEVGRLADGSPIVAVHGGDLTHGDAYVEQLISTRKADQIFIAVANMEPVMALPGLEAVRLIEGTGAHDFGEGTASVLVADRLAAQHPQVDIAVRAHALFDVDGAFFDCAHRGPSPGIRNWTAGNQLRYYARSIMMDALADGEDPPDAVVRAHNHLLRHETVRVHTKRGTFKTEAIILPSYCGLSSYARHVTRSEYRISNGLVAFEVEGGEIKAVHPFWRMVDLRTKEKL